MGLKLIAGGKVQDIDKSRGLKTMTVPGWLQRMLLEEETGGPSAGLYAKSSWAYSCINIRADAIASIPWAILRGEDEAEGTELERVLLEVNPEMNWPDLIRATEADLNIVGKAFWLKVRNRAGKGPVRGLQRLNPNAVKIKANANGIQHFELRLRGKAPEKIERKDMVLFRLYDPNNDYGAVPPLEVAKEDILAEAHADAYLSDFFRNYAMPAAIVNFKDGAMRREDLEQVKRDWLSRFRRKRNAPAFTAGEGGIEVETLGYSLKELAMAEVREEARRAICAAFRVPMPLAGASESANYATMAEQRASLYTETIIPRAQYIAGVINAELAPEFGDGLRFEWRFSQLDALQAVQFDKAKGVAELVKAGVITPEAGARFVGFDEHDVGPGPMLMPIRSHSSGGNGRSPLHTELQRWSRKAQKRVAEGKSAAVPFESEHIPVQLSEAIMGALEEAHTKAEVKAVFMGLRDYELLPYVLSHAGQG